MGSRRLHRNAVVSILRVEDNSYTRTTTQLDITDLRIGFAIEKSHTKDPNPCKVTIHNLSEASRAGLQHKPLQIRVAAGHDGEYATLYLGDVRWCENTLEGVDWVTKIEAGSGERAHKHARVTQSFRGGVTVGDIAAKAAKAAGFTLSPSVLALPAMKKQLAGGYAAHGPVHKELTRILAPHGLTWSVQDGQLQILAPDQFLPGEALQVGPPPDGSMIGSPTAAAPKAPGKPATLTVRMMLEPALLPGSLLRVKSRGHSGDYLATRVVHTGDTFAEDWSTEVEAVPKR